MNEAIETSIERGCVVIVLPPGRWELSRTLFISDLDRPLTLKGQSEAHNTVLFGRINLLMDVRAVRNLTIHSLTLEGDVRLDESEDVSLRNLVFNGGTLHLPGRRCNQPNECTSFNRRLRIEDSIFNGFNNRAILAERLEQGVIRNNVFRVAPGHCSETTVAFELDGSGEDLDRPLEYGHNKGNLIVENFFETEATTAMRLQDSLGNTIRDNRFVRPYRAMEFLQGARHNYVAANYITYLSQAPTTSVCPKPCGVYLAPGSVNNIFQNNFFEQSFELQFLERNRNRTFVIDESGGQNVFRSDFLRFSQ